MVGNLGGVCGGVGRCTQATMHHQSNRPNNQAGHSKCYVCETCMQCCPLMCVLQGLIRAQTMRRHHLAKWCAHFCKMGVLEAWHQIDTSVKQAEQASHSKRLFHVSDCPWCCPFRILSTPMDPFGASIATGVRLVVRLILESMIARIV